MVLFEAGQATADAVVELNVLVAEAADELEPELEPELELEPDPGLPETLAAEIKFEPLEE